jgi:hypothetical protein
VSKLTSKTKGHNCIRCGSPDAYACHYNGIRQHSFGKGRGIKANNLMTAEFCYHCDQLYTEGSTVGFDDKVDRSEQFMFWVSMTNIARISRGDLIIN